MPTIEDGVVRQVWFAPAASPLDVNSFLIRDDAYSEREAIYGRTIRLGEPVDLGPFGTWRQTNWSGGHDQETWRDDAMYELGTADVSERKGSVKLWNGFTEVYGTGARPLNYIGHLMPGATGLGDSVPLIFAERTLSGSPTNWRIRRYIPGSGITDIDTFLTGQVQALSLIGNETGTATGYMLAGFADGTIRRWDQAANTWAAAETVVGTGAIGYRCMTPFNNATYYVRGNRLQKRVNGVHTEVRAIPEITKGHSMTVWNNRIWFIGIQSQGKSGVYVSDGYTVQLAFQVPGNVYAFDLCPHYGSLYVRGVVNRYGAVRNERQQVWRYNGSSLVLLHEEDNSQEDIGEHGGMASWGRHLVWSKHGSTAMGRTAGVWMYDAEEDAIYQGPSINQADPSSTKVTVGDVCVWNNTLAISFVDHHTYTASTNENPTWVAFLEKTVRPRAINLDGTTSVDQDRVANTVTTSFSSRSFNYPQTSKTQVILSSAFDAELAGEKKVWVKGYLRCRVPANTRIRLALLHDDATTEHLIKTINFDSGVGAGWQDVQFSATCATHLTHERSSKVRYKLYLDNILLASSPLNTPEVDVVGLDFLASPERRNQHHLRILARDGQNTLAGTPNTLTTRDGIVAKLKSYWQSAVPVLFWGPYSTGAAPVGPGTPVNMSDWMDQSVRIVSDSPEVASEVSFNALEVA